MSPDGAGRARRRVRRRTRPASGRSASSPASRRPRSRCERDPTLLRRRPGAPRHDHLPDHDRRQHPRRQPALRRHPGRRLDLHPGRRRPGQGARRRPAADQLAGLPGDDDQPRQHRRRGRAAEADRHPAGQRPARPAGARRTPSTATRSSTRSSTTGTSRPARRSRPTSPYASPAGEACVAARPGQGPRAAAAEAGRDRCRSRSRCKTSNTADSLRYAQALQAAVEPGGFALRIEPVEYSTLLDQQTARRLRRDPARLVGPHRPARQHEQLPGHRRRQQLRRLQQRRRRRR